MSTAENTGGAGGEPAPLRLVVQVAPWLQDAGVRSIMAALTAEGAEARFVGGCVRDALLAANQPDPGSDQASSCASSRASSPAAPDDVDIAVNRPPEEVMRLAEAAGLKPHPTGLEHGVVTIATGAPRGETQDVADSSERALRAVEVASLRRDVATDGRRAVIAFTEDWREDAARRDFTMNALYADASGRVFDPLGEGLADLRAGRVRFIGDAETRIREDYLRILRFFRFHARFGANGGVDAAEMAAITRLAPGLDTLPSERVGVEIKKLFAAPAPWRALALLEETGVMRRVFRWMTEAGAAGRAERLGGLEAVEAREALPPRWIRRLAALFPWRSAGIGGSEGGLLESRGRLATALDFSRADLKSLSALGQAAALGPGETAYRFDAATALDAAALEAAAEAASDESRGTIPLEVKEAIAQGAAAEFPLRAADLMAAGLKRGPALGAALARAERAWIDSGFQLDRDALIAARLP